MSDVFVVDGYYEISNARSEFSIEKRVWESECWAIRNSFVKKTSTVKTSKNGNKKEYTYWYKVKTGGGLQMVGKDEPNYQDLYPPAPTDPIEFKFEVINRSHIILNLEDYEKNKDLFMECFVFPYSSLLIGGGCSCG